MKHILIFGDSNTWGYDASTYIPSLGSGQRMAWNERWPGRVQALLGEEYRIIENALNARTNMVDDPYFPNRLGLKSLEVALDANAPLDLVVLQMGCNELKHMFNLTAGMIAFGVEHLVQACHASYYAYPAPKVLLIAPHPTPSAHWRDDFRLQLRSGCLRQEPSAGQRVPRCCRAQRLRLHRLR